MGKWLGLGAGVAALLAIDLLVGPPLRPAPVPGLAQDPAQAACRAAQKAVKERLKTVATALFPACTEAKVQQTGPGQWQVEGRFDADFLFGENARTGYSATVQQRQDRTEVTELNIWP